MCVCVCVGGGGGHRETVYNFTFILKDGLQL